MFDSTWFSVSRTFCVFALSSQFLPVERRRKRGTCDQIVTLLPADGSLQLRFECQQRNAMFLHFGNTIAQLLNVDFQVFNGLLAGDQLFTEVEAFFVRGRQNDRRGPRTIHRIKAHHPGIRENADQHEIQHRDGKRLDTT